MELGTWNPEKVRLNPPSVKDIVIDFKSYNRTKYGKGHFN